MHWAGKLSGWEAGKMENFQFRTMASLESPKSMEPGTPRSRTIASPEAASSRQKPGSSEAGAARLGAWEAGNWEIGIWTAGRLASYGLRDWDAEVGAGKLGS